MILCCGEALIDMLPRETAAGEAAFAPHAGGAVFNTAIALGRLGVRTEFFSGLSSDLFGAQLAAALAASGVGSGLAHVSDRPTTLAFVTLSGGQARYAFYDENTAGRMLGAADLPAPPDGLRAAFFGGISLVAEPCGTAYETLALRLAQAGHVVMLDPNIRPGFIRDEAAYRARIARMIAAATIVKLSDEDLDWLTGGAERAAAVAALLAQGPKLLCITEGARGATGYTGTQAVSVAAVPVQVADTVGAGDTFNAGVLAALDRAGALTRDGLARIDAETLRTALALGVRAAAVTVSRPGANPPWARELD